MATVIATVTARKESKTTRIALQRACEVDFTELQNWIVAQRDYWRSKGYAVSIECGPMTVNEALQLQDTSKGIFVL
jgi:hypothetical protein